MEATCSVEGIFEVFEFVAAVIPDVLVRMCWMVAHVHYETKSDGMIDAGCDRSAMREENWLVDQGGRS
eukprot:scaffold2365_cov77-Skeletonema_dohrnii-CCMP3373.AAC.30